MKTFLWTECNITATIANLGAIDAHNFSVIFDGLGQRNTSGMSFSTLQTSLHLPAGNSTNITVSWKPPERGYYTINVSVTFVPLVDNDETNNMMSKDIIQHQVGTSPLRMSVFILKKCEKVKM
ncbi:MAG: hypothetical protein MW690_001650 [Methanophagales archaeon]|nr:hypothetical protein [Methanophagales archaeon]